MIGRTFFRPDSLISSIKAYTVFSLLSIVSASVINVLQVITMLNITCTV